MVTTYCNSQAFMHHALGQVPALHSCPIMKWGDWNELCFTFCYFRKLTATTHDGIDGGLRGSWSCIEKRAQTWVATLIKTCPDLSQALGKEGWTRLEKAGEDWKVGEEKGKARAAAPPPPKKTFTAPFGRGLCWTLINGYCSLWTTQWLFTVSHKGGLYSCSGMHCDRIIWIAEGLTTKP